MAGNGSQSGPKVRERTINFYEIVKYVNFSTNERMIHADWQSILEALASVPLRERVWEGPEKTLIGEVMRVDGQSHLKLMLVRDQDSWLDVYNSQKDTVGELQLEDSAQLLETSIVAFLPYGNVIGLIQGSTTAPTPGGFAQWLNGLKVLADDFTVDTEPMVSREIQNLINQSAELDRISVKVHTNRADALEKRGSKLSSVLRAVKEEYGSMVVTVILQPGRAKDMAAGRAAVREEAKVIAEASDNNEVRSAKGRLVYIEADDKRHGVDVDFAKQKITAKRRISTTSEDGSPIRNESAVRAIVEVALEHEAELRKIVQA
ncbi:hypothetical protein AB6V29_05555 [Microbacterium sp. 20-116]|uniref:hypothetical protein n=1 Tax=Microbacterium sp. 20-116 TaxID=3239883 RepID=UPI0034E2640C